MVQISRQVNEQIKKTSEVAISQRLVGVDYCPSDFFLAPVFCSP
jgi:hypothetical protein